MSGAAELHRCTVVEGDLTVSFDVRDGHRLLHEMIVRRATAIPVGCRGGGCGVCRVQVIEGTYTARRMSRRHVTEAAEADGYVLACRTVPTSDIMVQCAPSPASILSSA